MGRIKASHTSDRNELSDMLNVEPEDYKDYRDELRFHDELLRLYELRLEELERRISFLEATSRRSS